MRLGGVAMGVLLALTLTASAGANSQITSPPNSTYVFRDLNAPGPPPTVFTIHGTSGDPNIDLNCYTGSGQIHRLAHNLATGTGGAFTFAATANEIPADPCVLRAVPTDDLTPRPPGLPDPNLGPRIALTTKQVGKNGSVPFEYEIDNANFGGEAQFFDAGECGLETHLFADSYLVPSDFLFNCAGGLYRGNFNASNVVTRSEIQVDGTNAYTPEGADQVNFSATGFPAISVSDTFDAATGNLSLTEIAAIVRCSPGPGTYPPTKSSCSSFVPSGVELERTWTTSGLGRVVTETDAWKPTDGHQHAVDLLYDDIFASAFGTGTGDHASFDFPGSGGFTTPSVGNTFSVPRGTGTLLVKEDRTTPDAGDGTHPQGSMTWASAPDGPVQTTFVDMGPSQSFEFLMPYIRTVPAGGALTLRFAYSTSYDLPTSQAFGAAARAAFLPSVAITSPASGTTTSTANVNVAGTAADSLGVASLTLDGQPVPVGAGGAWSAPVTLAPGVNTLTAVVTNVDGSSAQTQAIVDYVPPSSPQVTLAAGGSPTSNGSGVSERLTCNGPAGSTCNGSETLTSTELLNGKKVQSVTSAARHKLKRRTVVVGTRTFSIQAGTSATITVPLNALGRKLLKRFGKLPVKLTVKFVTAAGKVTTAKTAKLTVKPHKKKHRKR